MPDNGEHRPGPQNRHGGAPRGGRSLIARERWASKARRPHAGGVFPILIGRWDHGATVRPEVKDLKNPPSHYLRRFHYDTVAHSTPILMNLVQQVGVDRIVAGTDFPADMSDVDPVRTVESLTALSTAERDLILRGNAARLLKLDA